MRERLRIVVAATMAAVPDQGGAQWAVLQYVLGLRTLGHDVWLVEPVTRDAASGEVRDAFARIAGEFDLRDRASLAIDGAVPEELERAAAGADLLLNVSGVLGEGAVFGSVRRRAYVDLDPAFTQLWEVADGIDMGLGRHDRHVTVGLAVGDPSCDIPTAGAEWITTVPPVVLDRWPVGDELAHDAFTTVGNWRGYGSVEWQGTKYGQRAHAFRPLLRLPGLTGQRLLPALAIHPDERADLDALAEHGWSVLDPTEVASTPDDYRSFVRGSKGELGVAKSGYVLSRSGWFSDRSACYLAAGRPVIAQDTGFSRFLPTGEGLLGFDAAEDAAERIEDVAARYEQHRKAARGLAEEVFDSNVVLPRLLDRLAS